MTIFHDQEPTNKIIIIYDNNEYAQLMLEYNQLCPPYPECIPEHHLGTQYILGCEQLEDP